MEKIIIAPACTDLNRGDQALTWESANVFLNYGQSYEVEVLDYGNTEHDRLRQSKQTKEKGYTVISNFLLNPKRVLNKKKEGVHLNKLQFLLVGFVALFDFFKALLLLLLPYSFVMKVLYRRKSFLKTFSDFKGCKAVVYKGGGFLHVYGKLGDFYYLWYGLYYALLALRLKKKVIIMPNSIGPIEGWHCRLLIKFVLKRCSLVTVREKKSSEYLNQIGINNSHYFPDLGYFVLSSYKEQEDKEKICIKKGFVDKCKLGITVRPYRFPHSEQPDEQYKKYISSIVEFCKYYKDEFVFYFVEQVQGPSAHESDILAINEIVEKIKGVCDYEIVSKEVNYLGLMSIYEEMDFLIGTRFHSVIFSHVLKVPAIAIAYGGNKSIGIMQEIGLDDYVITIEEITSDALISTFFKLRKNEKQYREKLDSYLKCVHDSKNNLYGLVNGVLR